MPEGRPKDGGPIAHLAGSDRRLVAAIGNPAIIVTRSGGGGEAAAVPPPLTPAIMGPAEEVARTIFPHVPVVPNLLTAGTDGRYPGAAGIPTYGVPGIMLDADGNGAHGVNERIRTRSLYEGRDYLYALIRRYAGGRQDVLIQTPLVWR